MRFRIWTLSLEGNAATRRQVDAVGHGLEALLQNAGCDQKIILPPASAKKLVNGAYETWTSELPLDELMKTAAADGVLMPPWPDMVVSCRPEVAAIALSIKAANQGKTRIVHIQNPNDKTGTYVFPLGQFDIILIQPQETLEGANVVASKMALHGLTPDAAGAIARPLVAMLVGGTDENLAVTPKMWDGLREDIADLAVKVGQGTLCVLTSRRTDPAFAAELKALWSFHAHVKVDDPALPYDMALGLADTFVVTADSLSMVSEAMATGRPVSVYDYRGRAAGHPLMPVFRDEADAGTLDFYHDGFTLRPVHTPPDEVPELCRKIAQKLKL